MTDAVIPRVRRFNRFITARVGALDDHYLARDRPLGASRLLWEIGPMGRDVRWLRSELDLDSGYLSRLLRSLEAAGLVRVGPKDSDRRIRFAELTAAGRRERALLDRRSDELARSLVESLDELQQERLCTAMAEVERLLTAAMVEVEPTDPEDPRAQHCLREYIAELDRRFEYGFDPQLSVSATMLELRPPAGIFLVASFRSAPVGCGALIFHEDEPPHVKRMWVAQSARGMGLGRRLLAALERRAVEHGAHAVRLETNKALLEAMTMYRSAGYVEVTPFNDEPYAHHWFQKELP